MSIDLKSFITKNQNVKDEDISEELMSFLDFLKHSFNIPQDFINNITKNYKYLFQDELLNLDIFADPQYYVHIDDYSEARSPDTLSFVLSVLLPEFEIVDYAFNNYSDDYDYDDEDEEEKSEKYSEELQRLIEHYNEVNVLPEIINSITEWLNKDYISWRNDWGCDGMNYQSYIISSKYIYEISKDNKLKKLLSKVFPEFDLAVDEENKLGYLWLSMVSGNSGYPPQIFNLNNWEDLNMALTNKYNLVYDQSATHIFQKIKQYSVCYKSTLIDLIDEVISTYEVKKEVMF